MGHLGPCGQAKAGVGRSGKAAGMVTFDLKLLAKTAETVHSMNEFLDALVLPRTPRIRRTMGQRLRRSGIDTSHWERSGSYRYSHDEILNAVEASTSYAGTLRLLGVPVTGGQHAHLARRIRQEGIDTAHFVGQAHYRGRRAPRKDPAVVLVLAPAGSGRPRTQVLRRALLSSGVAHRCAICGCGPEWRGQPLVLEIDHIDGSWLDNRIDNVRFLCPNCHAQTPNHSRRSDRTAPTIDGQARLAELADATALGAVAFGCGGSSPPART